jgi:hypothetical protein
MITAERHAKAVRAHSSDEQNHPARGRVSAPRRSAQDGCNGSLRLTETWESYRRPRRSLKALPEVDWSNAAMAVWTWSWIRPAQQLHDQPPRRTLNRTASVMSSNLSIGAETRPTTAEGLDRSHTERRPRGNPDPARALEALRGGHATAVLGAAYGSTQNCYVVRPCRTGPARPCGACSKASTATSGTAGKAALVPSAHPARESGGCWPSETSTHRFTGVLASPGGAARLSRSPGGAEDEAR